MTEIVQFTQEPAQLSYKAPTDQQDTPVRPQEIAENIETQNDIISSGIAAAILKHLALSPVNQRYDVMHGLTNIPPERCIFAFNEISVQEKEKRKPTLRIVASVTYPPEHKGKTPLTRIVNLQNNRQNILTPVQQEIILRHLYPNPPAVEKK